MRRQNFDPAHQHVEQAFARRLLFHVAHVLRQHGAVDGLDVGGEDTERRGEFAAQLRERHAGTAGVSLAQLRGEFSSTLGILAAHVKTVDRAVLAQDMSDMEEEPARETPVRTC